MKTMEWFDKNGELKPEIEEAMEKYFQEYSVKEDIMSKRAQKLRHYLEETGFDNFIGRIIREHGEDYCDMCYKKGCEPYPNNKYYLLLKLVEIEGEQVDKNIFDCCFPNQVIKYNNYYFQWIWGQGVINNIYDNRKELLLSL